MSFPWKPPIFDPRGRTLQWLNTCWSAHDEFCGCDSVFLHFVTAATNSNLHKPTEEETKQIEKCLGDAFTPTTTNKTEEETGDAVDGLEPGELDALFALPDAETGENDER